MINKLRRIVRENREFHKSQVDSLRELEWAQVYHDSIRGHRAIQELPLNIGRWAGNYTFFYVLNRVLKDYKPLSIFEMGLGESSKFISTFLDSKLNHSSHMIIEQDENWANTFKSQFLLSERSRIKVCSLKKNNVKGHEVNVYKDFENYLQKDYDLYVVDGPHGSPRFSRYDIVYAVESMNKNHEFVIILDDYNRQGEKDTFYELQDVFKRKGIKIYHETYFGAKAVKIIATEKYKFSCSI